MADIVKEGLRRQHQQEGVFDGMSPQFAKDAKPTFKGGGIEPCVIPKNWYLGSLPPERLQRSLIVRFSDFTSNVNVRIEPANPLQVRQGDTFVAFLYHFFATTPVIGNRTEMLRPHELLGFLNLKMRSKSAKTMPYIMDSSVNGATLSGMPFVTDDPYGDWQEIPIFFNGPISINPTYDVVVDPPFEIQEVGFALGGFLVATKDLQRAVERCSVLDR